jgi:hypothetical protein
MQRFTVFFTTVNALELYVPGLLAATTSGGSKQAWHVSEAVCTVF